MLAEPVVGDSIALGTEDIIGACEEEGDWVTTGEVGDNFVVGLGRVWGDDVGMGIGAGTSGH